MLVRDRMSAPPLTIRPDLDYKKALDLMENNQLHHLPVVNADGALLGMVAERDLLIAAVRYLAARIDISEVMHEPVITVTPDTPMAAAAKLMVDNNFGGLPVVEEGAVVGIITETDIFRAFVASAAAD